MSVELNLFTVDIETTMNGNEHSGLSHPMHPDNKTVMIGYMHPFWKEKVKFPNRLVGFNGSAEIIDFIVGHNVGFDLKYLFDIRKSCNNKVEIQRCRLWDTQLAEYLLTGQQTKWASLDDLATKYGLPLKDNKVKEYFDRGEGADKVPAELLKEYLKQDVENTDRIARIQIAKAVELEMLPLIISQMESLHATIEMEYNGLAIDIEFLKEFSRKIERTAENFKELAERICKVDVASNKQLSMWFFGGVEKYKVKEAVGMYKNGKVKYKLVEKTKKIEKQLWALNEWENKTGYSVDDEVLQCIVDYGWKGKEVAKYVLKYREYSKIKQTYCDGITNNILNDRFIYGNLNHCATATGRLSSSNPNLQNFANSEVKKAIVSRWGDDGKLVEFDFKQLEVVVLAHLSGDKQLICDIQDGIDIHEQLFKEMYGYKPSKEERKPFKSRTFQLIYGAGPAAIAKAAKVSLDDGKKFVETFYKRYPSVKDWHEKIAEIADKEGRVLDETGKIISTASSDINVLKCTRQYTMIAETGRRYHFKEYPSQDWKVKKTGRLYSFSPTELKNYPVQGLATGDIVPMMLGILFRRIVVAKNNYDGKALLVNTIHDSILCDVHNDVLTEFILEVKQILDNTHKYFEGTFGHLLSLKLEVGVSVGPNWYEMEEYAC